MVICLERCADLHMAQLMPLPLTVSCFSKIQIGFTFLVPAHPGSPGKKTVKRVCVRVCVCLPVNPGASGKTLDFVITFIQAICFSGSLNVVNVIMTVSFVQLLLWFFQ